MVHHPARGGGVCGYRVHEVTSMPGAADGDHDWNATSVAAKGPAQIAALAGADGGPGGRRSAGV